MAKHTIQTLVVFLDGEVNKISGIDDIYSNMQICLESDKLTDEDILTYFNHMSDDYAKKRLEEVRAKGYLCDGQEAKDLTCKLSRYEIRIKDIELDTDTNLFLVK